MKILYYCILLFLIVVSSVYGKSVQDCRGVVERAVRDAGSDEVAMMRAGDMALEECMRSDRYVGAIERGYDWSYIKIAALFSVIVIILSMTWEYFYLKKLESKKHQLFKTTQVIRNKIINNFNKKKSYHICEYFFELALVYAKGEIADKNMGLAMDYCDIAIKYADELYSDKTKKQKVDEYINRKNSILSDYGDISNKAENTSVKIQVCPNCVNMIPLNKNICPLCLYDIEKDECVSPFKFKYAYMFFAVMILIAIIVQAASSR